MEQDILEQLYYGRIVPWEKPKDQIPEAVAFCEQADQDIRLLEKLLDDEGRKILKRFLENISERECRLICEGFKDGFRLGMQLAAAGLDSGKQP